MIPDDPAFDEAAMARAGRDECVDPFDALDEAIELAAEAMQGARRWARRLWLPRIAARLHGFREALDFAPSRPESVAVQPETEAA